ncbi:hypothetical protein ACS8E3_08975 [Psychrobacter sp. 2Y5]|uniref:hypothetical protein n=1 Tax=unclassified Psychrobacter TaxID=196806 RepID=UPI003F48F607
MSDTRQPLLSTEQRQRSELYARQQQAQQRQILAMMGIGQWVRPDSPTLKISDIADSAGEVEATHSLTEQQPVLDEQVEPDVRIDDSVDKRSTTAPVAPDDEASTTDHAKINSFDNDSFDVDVANNDDSLKAINKSYNFNDLNSFSESERIEEANHNAETISLDKVAPFDLQGARYGNWVLIVDIQALDNDSQKLWQNIMQALSLDCETSSFPICAGMDTAELANASLAGYIFKIAQSEDIQVAALTALPEGLTHPALTEVPTLQAMLAEATLKRQLWQHISN